MSRRPTLRKRRTRQHVIVDLSVNHVERHVLRCGFSVERIRTDYGFDPVLFLYDPRGRTRPGRVLFQLKATDYLELRNGGATLACAIDARDFNHWLDTPEPVILILYDAAADRAYWLYVQADLGSGRRRSPSSITVHIPRANVVDANAVRRFDAFNDAIVSQRRDIIYFHD